ncbi:MAG: tetratricopeptide repeat protein [Elusimicrobiota bacterium]|nr:tetratricopeptide repeat protein [Elusimicrobiota bacterium]
MKKFIFFAILCCALPPAFCQSAARYYSMALKSNDDAEQIKLFTKAIEKNPRLTEAYHRRGDLYRKKGALKSAMADYTKTISLAPKNPFKYYARALAYMDAKDYVMAADDFTKAIKLKSDFDAFYYNRALAYYKLERYRDALRDIAVVKNKKKFATDIVMLEGKANFSLYNYSAARKAFERAAALDPQNAEAFFYIGRIEFNNEMYDEAISYFSKALNADGSYAAAYRLRAAAFKEIEDYPAALEDYGALISLTPNYASYNLRGLIYETIENYSAALEDFNAAVSANPKWAIAYNNRGYSYLKMKNYKKAFEDFETALKLAANLPTPYINMAGYYWTAKKDKKNMYKYIDLAIKRNYKDLDSLYEENKKGWMFKNINNTIEFRSFLSNYSKN